jgi:hypothetical protein
MLPAVRGSGDGDFSAGQRVSGGIGDAPGKSIRSGCPLGDRKQDQNGLKRQHHGDHASGGAFAQGNRLDLR